MKTETIKGFNDYLGEEALKRKTIKQIIEETFSEYGFEPAETPIVESEEFVRGDNEKDEAVSDIFKLKDKGERKLALRYELTFPLKRIAKNQKLPYKRYSIGSVFRDEPVSSNRFRQFTQCDADIIGSNINDEAEILSLASKIMEKLKIKSQIFINNRKLLNEILEKENINEKNINAVLREIDKLDKIPESEIKKNLKKYNAEKILNIIKKQESFFKKYANFEEIEKLKKACALYSIQVKFKPSLARGLSYYNSTIFEMPAIAGGSYLINKIQSTGISFGLERISNLAKVEVPRINYLILSFGEDKKAVELAEKLRKNKKTVIIMLNKSPSRALDYADNKKIEKVIFIGKEEVKKKKIKIKNMKTGKEEFVGERGVLE